AQHRLAGARLADQAERPAPFEREVHAADGTHPAVRREEVGRQAGHLEQRRGTVTRAPGLARRHLPDGVVPGHSADSRTSNRARTASPRKLSASTVRKIAVAGASTTHGVVAGSVRPAAIIVPQVIVPVSTPAPSRLSPPSA